MNWYKQAPWYKQAVSRSRKLETIAKYLTTIVFHSLKQFKNENSFYIQELSLNVSYKVFFLKSLKKNEPPVVDGAYFPTTNSIHIRIGISQEDVGYYNNYNSIIPKNMYNTIYSPLLETFRHEIEHAWQNINGKLKYYKTPPRVNDDRYNSFLNIKNYILDNVEKEAFVASIVLLAKNQKIKVKDAIKIYVANYLNSFKNHEMKQYREYIKNHGSYNQLIEEISQSLFDFAKQKYHIKEQPILL